ncbi:MAG: hypothetical protein RR620_03415 [Clostridium sp.]
MELKVIEECLLSTKDSNRNIEKILKDIRSLMIIEIKEMKKIEDKIEKIECDIIDLKYR